MPHFSAADGTKIYYDVTGDGIPLLCLSGLTRNARDFDFVLPHLSGFRVIRMDYRGRGRSDWASYLSYDVPTEASDALELLDVLGVDKAAVLGTSRGGIIAMYLAATAGDRLRGVALNDVGPVIERAGLEAIKTYLGKHPHYYTHGEFAQARMIDPKFPGVPEDRWIAYLSHTSVETTTGLRNNYDPKLRDAVAPGFDAPQADAWPLFAAMEGMPLAIIHGANSDLLSAETVAEMARRHPGAIVATVPDRGHIPFLDEPEALAALRAWKEQLA